MPTDPATGSGAAGRIDKTRDAISPAQYAVVVQKFVHPELRIVLTTRIDEDLEFGVGHFKPVDKEIADTALRRFGTLHADHSRGQRVLPVESPENNYSPAAACHRPG